ncbi:putative nucleotidyltransferase [Lysinibacillus phage vB_LfM_LysYB1]|nr:putative nucleotidyltransferase [Lysinibacillus phage vB_LfM_LysYB1]WAB25392.1 putative nucleotidyltransferase [Lysinibacillus phage vB_LfM_LysYB2]
MHNLERRPIIKLLVGSHNYNLNGEGSDRDYKVFVMPTFEDLYKGNTHHDSILSESEDWDVQDIRKLPHLLFKSNLNYIETLYSVDKEMYATDYRIEELVKWLFDKKAELVTMNLSYLYSTCIAMHYTAMKYIEQDKSTASSIHLMGKYGFDTKQAMNAYRILDFLERFYHTEFKDLKKAMWYEGQARDTILNFKFGKYSKAQFLEIAEEKLLAIRGIRHYYEQPPNYELKKELDEAIMEIVRLGVK